MCGVKLGCCALKAELGNSEVTLSGDRHDFKWKAAVSGLPL
jgi:hypothetical protein